MSVFLPSKIANSPINAKEETKRLLAFVQAVLFVAGTASRDVFFLLTVPANIIDGHGRTLLISANVEADVTHFFRVTALAESSGGRAANGLFAS